MSEETKKAAEAQAPEQAAGQPGSEEAAENSDLYRSSFPASGVLARITAESVM